MEHNTAQVLMLQTNAAACSDQARYHQEEASFLSTLTEDPYPEDVYRRHPLA